MSLKENLLSKLSYTSRDYESIMRDLINILKSDDTLKVKNWDNLSEADPLFIILSLMAAHTDILNYMIDYRILENYMSTAKERASLVRIANSVGYKIRSFRPAYATFKITALSTPATLKLEPLGNQFIDGSGVGWVYAGPTRELTAEDLTNGTYLGFVQGAIATLDIQPSAISNRTHIISNMQVAIGSNIDNTITSRLKITGTTGEEEWTEVESVLGKTGRVYELNVDPLGTTYIRFPSDFDPTKYADSPMTLTYLVTNGFETQVQPPSISNLSLSNLTFEKGVDSIFVFSRDLLV